MIDPKWLAERLENIRFNVPPDTPIDKKLVTEGTLRIAKYMIHMMDRVYGFGFGYCGQSLPQEGLTLDIWKELEEFPPGVFEDLSRS